MRVAYAITTYLSGLRFFETLRMVPDGARLEVIQTKVRHWQLARAWNYAADKLLVEEGYDALLLCNDDIVMPEGLGDRLARALLEEQFEDPGHGDKEWLAVSAYNTKDRPDEGPRWDQGAIDYSCFCIGQKYWEVVGRFDENFIPAYFEDNDSHRRIRLAGYEAGCRAPYFHYGSETVLRDPERMQLIQHAGAFEANRRYYIAKHGGEPGRETFTHPFNDPRQDWRNPPLIRVMA